MLLVAFSIAPAHNQLPGTISLHSQVFSLSANSSFPSSCFCHWTAARLKGEATQEIIEQNESFIIYNTNSNAMKARRTQHSWTASKN